MMSTISRAFSLPSQSCCCCCCYWGFANQRKHPQNLVLRRRRSRRRQINAQLPDEILVQLLHNKVLIAAGVSGAIGQLTKPLSGVILYGKEFDIKAAFQAGGFPSTHSSAVVAAATCLGLERGFSDSLFGITVVYAGLIMYDAQGVRREVGIHARTLNKVLKEKSRANSIPSKNIDGFDSQPGKSSSTLSYLSDESGYFSSKTRNSLLVSKSEKKTSSRIPSGIKAAEANEGSERSKYSPLKESIGHTEVEVIAGALLGLLVSLVVNTLL